MISKGSHGTAVAGIIAARDNEIGIVGIAPKSKIMPLTVCDYHGCDYDKIYDAIIYATDNGAHVINISLGSRNGYIGYNSELDQALSYAYQKNVVIVVAAGNGDRESLNRNGENQTGMDLDFYKISPVSNKYVFGVGALDQSNQYRASWSNYGDGVEIYAPGQNIASTVVPAYSDGYGYDTSLSGTSFSAPIVSGAVALMKSYSTLNNSEIINRIIDKSNKGILDIKASLQGIDINHVRDLSVNPIISFSKVFPKYKINPEEIKSIAVKEVDENLTFVSDEKDKIKNIDTELSNKLKGKILLQVESHGEAWYVHPKTIKRHYMANGDEAYNIMRDLGVGITNVNLNKIKQDNKFAKKFSGTIFLQVEDLGQAFYIDFDGQAHYLKDGEAAYNIMRELGLGIKNQDIEKIDIE